jgi:hypothetical protein
MHIFGGIKPDYSANYDNKLIHWVFLVVQELCFKVLIERLNSIIGISDPRNSVKNTPKTERRVHSD